MFGLAGCGDVSLKTLNENFNALDQEYATYAQVFEQESTKVGQIDTKYKVNLGSVIEGKIQQKAEGFTELASLYASALAVSNNYIEKNRTYITENIKENELTKSAHKAINALNDSLKKFTKEIKNFVLKRNEFVDYFEGFGASVPDEKAQKEKLQRFKSSYGLFIEKNIDFSTKLAEAVESTGIFNLLQEIDLKPSDTRIVKEFIRAKVLPVFTKFQIDEIANKLNWDEVGNLDGKTKVEISDILSKLRVQFTSFVNDFVVKDTGYKQLSTEEMKSLFSKTEEFLLQTDGYFKSIEQLEIEKLALTYDNDMNEYKQTNKLAEVYLQNIKTFVNEILPNFLSDIKSDIYEI